MQRIALKINMSHVTIVPSTPYLQAEVLAKHYANLLNDRLATKDDLKDFEQRLDAKIENSEQRLWIKMLVLQIASIATIITALQYLN